MSSYYSEKLNSSNLFNVYQTDIPRVKQYLTEEIEFVKKDMKSTDIVLELGAGYGRIIKQLSPVVHKVVGIDISENNVEFGKDYLKDCQNCEMLTMDAYHLEFPYQFDVVLCLQNGLSAFKGNDLQLLESTLSVLKKGGKAYFSSYSDKFWEYRLEWFKEQADKGLLGKIDMDKTHNGNIICEDGFTATTFTPQEMKTIGEKSGYPYTVTDVDDSSVFLIINKE